MNRIYSYNHSVLQSEYTERQARKIVNHIYMNKPEERLTLKLQVRLIKYKYEIEKLFFSYKLCIIECFSLFLLL